MPLAQKRLLLEDSFGTFQPDRKRIVFESAASGRQFARIPGRLSLCDTINGNNRRYRRSVWEKNLSEGSSLQEAIKRNASFGLLEHPADGHVDLQSPIAVIITKANLTEADGVPVVDGEILVLGTPEGQRLTALIEAGWNPTVSSRGYGSLAKGMDGVDDVQDDYVCEGWDVVLKPSFVKAVLTPDRGEQVRTESVQPAAQPAAQPASKPAPNLLKESTPAPSAQTETAKPVETPKTMIQDIRNRLAALKGVDVSKLAPQQFAEGLTELQGLHQSAAKYLSEDMTRSWDVQKLHTEISSIEEAWSAAQAKPAATAAKLSEDHSKLLKVTSAVVTAAAGIKKSLGEKVAQLANLQSLLEQTITRGKYWKQRAELMEAKFKLSEDRLNFACRGLEKIAERYKADLSAVGKRLVEVELKDRLAESKEAQELLAKATKPAHVIAVREMLTKKPEAKKPVTESQAKPAAAAKPADKPADKSASPLREAATSPKVLTAPEAGPTQISESVAVAQRLSRAATLAS